MRKLLNSFASIAILAIFQTGSIAQVQEEVNSSTKVNSSGSDIQAFTAGGEQFSGELLSVRENSIMIYNSSNCRNNIKWWECVDQVKKDDIQKLIIEGKSYVWIGLGVGTVLGLASLLVTVDFSPGGYLNIPKFVYSEGVTIGAFLGSIIIGGVIGALTSTQDEVIEPFSEYDISGLSVYARYPRAKPAVLEKME